MKPSLPIFALIATIVVTTEATDPTALLNLKAQLGNFLLRTAASAIQAKQNLVRSSTSAIINAKTNFLQRQLPHFVHFKANQIHSLLELKKNFIKSKAALIGQLAGGGDAIQSAEQDVVPYSPPASPTSPIEEPYTSYSPLPPLEPPPPAALPAAPPVDVHQGPSYPYPPPSFLGKRESPPENARAQPSFRPHNQIQYSSFPTPPPPPPVRHIQYV